MRPALHDELVRTGLAVMGAVNEQLTFAHPEQPSIDTCHHVVFTEPGDERVSGRAAVAIHPGGWTVRRVARVRLLGWRSFMPAAS